MCDEPVTDNDSFECFWCERLQYRSCLKISDDQYKVLTNLPSNIMYFCVSCLYKLPSALIAFDKTEEVSSAFDRTLKYFEIKFSNKFDTLSDQAQ